MALHNGHHLLKTLLKFSCGGQEEVGQSKSNNKFVKEFSIEEKNQCFKRVREGFGTRKNESDKEKAQDNLEIEQRAKDGTITLDKVLGQMKLSTASFGFPQEWPLTRVVC